MFKESNKFEKFESKVWLSSPTMHGPEIEYEFLLSPVSTEQTRELLEIIEARSVKGSVIFCTQFEPKGWYSRILMRRDIQINRKKKSITRSSVKVALKVTLEKNGSISGPKKIGVFGASYLYSMFLRFGLIDAERKRNGYLSDMDNI